MERLHRSRGKLVNKYKLLKRRETKFQFESFSMNSIFSNCILNRTITNDRQRHRQSTRRQRFVPKMWRKLSVDKANGFDRSSLNSKRTKFGRLNRKKSKLNLQSMKSKTRKHMDFFSRLDATKRDNLISCWLYRKGKSRRWNNDLFELKSNLNFRRVRFRKCWGKARPWKCCTSETCEFCLKSENKRSDRKKNKEKTFFSCRVEFIIQLSWQQVHKWCLDDSVECGGFPYVTNDFKCREKVAQRKRKRFSPQRQLLSLSTKTKKTSSRLSTRHTRENFIYFFGFGFLSGAAIQSTDRIFWRSYRFKNNLFSFEIFCFGFQNRFHENVIFLL